MLRARGFCCSGPFARPRSPRRRRSEVPLVVDDSASSIKKTAKAVELLKQLGAYSDIEKVKASRNVRSGKGKMRNRRYVNAEVRRRLL